MHRSLRFPATESQPCLVLVVGYLWRDVVVVSHTGATTCGARS